MLKKTAVLLVNLGSPQSTKTSDVRRFLKQFLWDKRVVNLPRPLWWLILHFVILPFRPKKSASAYQKIWRSEGSPLAVFTQKLTEKLAIALQEDNIVVDYAMSYSEPHIAKKLTEFKTQAIENIIIIPLYPQYSSTTTASVYDSVIAVFNGWRHIPNFRFISNYHQHPGYIYAVAQRIQTVWETHGKAPMLLFSFHGLPEQLTAWGDPYYYQCLQTAQLLADELHLAAHEWQIVFQSRFGRAKWLQPYCVETLENLPQQGIKNVDIVCPGFAVDCLETLEEIALTNRDIFLQSGGETYRYISALNDDAAQVELLIALINSSV